MASGKCQTETELDTTTRGVRNPHVIDLITHIKELNLVQFLIIEDRPFSDGAQQIEELEEKFNNYLDYILDGFFLQQYPQYLGLPLAIEFQYHEAPSAELEPLLESMATFSRSVGIAFTHKLLAE